MAGVKDLNFAEQSWFFAVLSKICYSEPKEAKPQLKKMGYTNVTYLDKDGSQGYIVENRTENIVLCRGTETSDPRDAVQDAKVWFSREPRLGFVHTGFKQSVDRLWNEVKEHILEDGYKPVYFAGHSLGAAMASIMAVRMLHDPDMIKPKKLYTYGSPRAFSFIGSRLTCSGVEHHRWVNNMDIVPRSPGVLMGYGHFGQLHYINTWGNVVDGAGVFYRERDRIGAWKRAAEDERLGYVDSHAMDNYIAALENYKNGIIQPERKDNQ
jgi:triacylglycerol lipase